MSLQNILFNICWKIHIFIKVHIVMNSFIKLIVYSRARLQFIIIQRMSDAIKEKRTLLIWILVLSDNVENLFIC